MVKRLLIGLLLCSLCLGQYTKPPIGSLPDWSESINRGLVAWWIANEGAGSHLNDISGNIGQDMTLVADASWDGGKFGTCLKFDGTGDYAVVSKPVVSSKPLTFAAWVFPTDASSQNTVISIGETAAGTRDTIYLSFSSSAVIGLLQFVNDVFSSAQMVTPYVEDVWQHVVATVDVAGNVVIYLDGIPTSGLSIDAVHPTAADTTAIGAFIDNAGVFINNWTGNIDDVFVYNRVLNQQEVNQLYSMMFKGVDND